MSASERPPANGTLPEAGAAASAGSRSGGAGSDARIPLAAIRAARERIAPHLAPTPLRRLDGASEASGATVVGKLELFQPTRAFKVRGALNAVLALPAAARARGVVAASAGNHGLGLCWAARLAGVRATVVLPASAPAERIADVRALGGEAIVHGADWNAANAHAEALAEARGLTMIPPFDHADIMAGQGTLALELLEQLPEVEVVVCSIGGGGLISGVASALRALAPHVRIYGVETEGADCMARSLAAGRLVELPEFRSVASSLGTRRSSERPFAIVRDLVDDVVVVSNEATLAALVALLDRDKLFAEPAASCALAALAEGRIPDVAGRRVAPIVCGANVTLRQLVGWLERYGLDLAGRPAGAAGQR